MPFDYDLLVIGSSLAGTLTAIRATHYRARVAIVRRELIVDNMLWSALLNKAAIESLPNNKFTLSEYVAEIYESFKNEYSSATLSRLGIDVIEDWGEFSRGGFMLKRGLVRSRSYVLAIESTPSLPNIVGLSQAGYLTIVDCQSINTIEKLPSQVVIIGFHTQALEFAQALAKLGKKVTLVINQQYFLYQIDPDYLKIIFATLKVAGVELIIDETILQIERQNEKKILLFVNSVLYCDEIILVPSFYPNLEDLNLESMGVNYKQIKINSKLQTTNPSIYSFRNSDGLKFDSNEIETILKNSLFLPIFYIRNSPITEIIHTKPSYIQIGYSEKDARKTFKKSILVGKNYFNRSLKYQISGEGSGFIKLIAKTNLELIGATIVGNEAEEMVNLVSLLIAKKTSLDKLLKITYPLLSNSHIIYQAALNTMHKVNKNRFDNWFIWRKL